MRRSSLPLNSSTTISQSEPRLAVLEHASFRGISWPTKSLEVVLSRPLGLGRQAIGTSYAARDLLTESRHVSQHGWGMRRPPNSSRPKHDRCWHIAKFSTQNSVAIGAWRTSSKLHPVQFG